MFIDNAVSYLISLLLIAGRGCLIGRLGSVDLDFSPIGGVADAVSGTLEEGGTIQTPNEPGESGSRRDREQPGGNYVPSPMLDCVDDPPGRSDPRGPLAAAGPPPLRALVRGVGHDMSSTCLQTPFWSFQVSY